MGDAPIKQNRYLAQTGMGDGISDSAGMTGMVAIAVEIRGLQIRALDPKLDSVMARA